MLILTVLGCSVQLSNTSFTEYVTEKIIKPANLTNTYYWIGGQGMEPQGLRKNIVTIPGYLTTFRGSDGGTKYPFQQPCRHSHSLSSTIRSSASVKCCVAVYDYRLDRTSALCAWVQKQVNTR